jgi:hypothetical protein
MGLCRDYKYHLVLGAACGLLVAGWEVAKSIRIVPVRTMLNDVKWMAKWVRTRFV